MTLVARPPAHARALNRLLDGVADRWIDLGAPAMRRRAQWETGLRDFGDDGFDARMEACCSALQQQTNLSPIGRLGAALYYHFKAVNRLRLVDFLKRRPDVDEVPVEAPIFIVGWYRTGTTFLHNMLAADPAHRAPLAWELISPAPQAAGPAVDRRMRMLRSRTLLLLNRLLIPEQGAAHDVPWSGPEECFFLLENDFVSSTLYNTFQGYDYAYDLLDQDLRPSYRFLKRQLQVLGWRQPERRWVLKSPFHLWHLGGLLDVFPDARIVFTHRDITQSLPSNCSLSAMTTSKFARSLDLHSLGRFWQDYYRVGMERAALQRKRIAPDRSFDVSIGRMGGDPLGLIEELYARFDLPLDGARAAMEQRARELGGGGGKPHEYGLEEFGLDAGQLQREFSGLEAGVGAAPGTEI